MDIKNRFYHRVKKVLVTNHKKVTLMNNILKLSVLKYS